MDITKKKEELKVTQVKPFNNILEQILLETPYFQTLDKRRRAAVVHYVRKYLIDSTIIHSNNLWLNLMKRKEFTYSVSFDWKNMRKMFGRLGPRGKTKDQYLVVLPKFFDRPEENEGYSYGNKTVKYTKPSTLKKKYKELFYERFSMYEKAVSIGIKRREFDAILPTDDQDNPRFTRYQINRYLPINFTAIFEKIKALAEERKPEYERCSPVRNFRTVPMKYDPFIKKEMMIGKLMAIGSLSTNGFGDIEQFYIEVSAGRIVGLGNIHIQRMSPDIRKILFQKTYFYDYDISNCHYKLFSHLSNKYGYEPKWIEYYLQNKREVRESLNDYLGFHKDSLKAKKCLIPIIYGAKITNPHGKIFKRYGAEISRLLSKFPLVIEMLKEIKKGSELILDNAETIQRNGETLLLNALGKTKPFIRRETSKNMSHVLQGLESKILEVIVEKNKSTTFHCLIHDGWISDKKMKVTKIRQQVKQELDIDIDIDENCFNE